MNPLPIANRLESFPELSGPGARSTTALGLSDGRAADDGTTDEGAHRRPHVEAERVAERPAHDAAPHRTAQLEAQQVSVDEAQRLADDSEAEHIAHAKA